MAAGYEQQCSVYPPQGEVKGRLRAWGDWQGAPRRQAPGG
eukprot:gene26023-49809_t